MWVDNFCLSKTTYFILQLYFGQQNLSLFFYCVLFLVSVVFPETLRRNDQKVSFQVWPTKTLSQFEFLILFTCWQENLLPFFFFSFWSRDISLLNHEIAKRGNKYDELEAPVIKFWSGPCSDDLQHHMWKTTTYCLLPMHFLTKIYFTFINTLL